MDEISKTPAYLKLKSMKKNHAVFDQYYDKVVFRIEDVSIPFGIETYQNHHLLNVELNISKNNGSYNSFVTLSDLTKKIEEIADLPKEIDGKEFYPLLKKNGTDTYIVRCYLKSSTIFDTNADNLKGKNCTIECELGSLWVNRTHFGVTVYIRKISQILNPIQNPI